MFSNNYLFLLDQGRDMLAVKEIIFDHHPTLIGPYTSLAGVFQGPLYYYLLSVPTYLMGGDPLGPLVLMVVISMTTIGIAGYFMYKTFGYAAAIVVVILFAVSPEAVAAATYTWNPHPMWLLITLYLIFLFQIHQNKMQFHLFLWPSLSLMFHFQLALGAVLTGVTVLYFLIFQRKLMWNKKMLQGVFLAFIFFLPQILFEVRHDFLMSRSVINLLGGGDRGLATGGEQFSYVALVDNHKGVFVNNYISSFISKGLLKFIPGILFALSAAFFLFGKVILNKREFSFIRVLGIVVFLVYAISFLYPYPLRYWFLTGFQVFYIFIAAILIARLVRKRIFFVISVIVLVLMAFPVYEKLDMLYVNPPNDGGTAKIKGKKAAVDFIYNDASGKPFGLFVFTPPVKTDAYDYVVWWYGQKKYGYLPHSDKEGLFYLLMEKDPDKPWSNEGWMETVIKTGQVLETTTLPSGLIVQKRMQENRSFGTID